MDKRERSYLVFWVVSDTDTPWREVKSSLVLRQLLSHVWEAEVEERSRDYAYGRHITKHLLKSAEIHKSGSTSLSTIAVKVGCLVWYRYPGGFGRW